MAVGLLEGAGVGLLAGIMAGCICPAGCCRLAGRMGMPLEPERQPLRVDIRHDAAGLHWNRRFANGRVLRSLFVPVNRQSSGYWLTSGLMRGNTVSGWRWPCRAWGGCCGMRGCWRWWARGGVMGRRRVGGLPCNEFALHQIRLAGCQSLLTIFIAGR